MENPPSSDNQDLLGDHDRFWTKIDHMRNIIAIIVITLGVAGIAYVLNKPDAIDQDDQKFIESLEFKDAPPDTRTPLVTLTEIPWLDVPGAAILNLNDADWNKLTNAFRGVLRTNTLKFFTDEVDGNKLMH